MYLAQLASIASHRAAGVREVRATDEVSETKTPGLVSAAAKASIACRHDRLSFAAPVGETIANGKETHSAAELRSGLGGRGPYFPVPPAAAT